MRGSEAGFLLLTSQLGNPERKPLTVAQLRTLAKRVRNSSRDDLDREITPSDLVNMGYSQEMAFRILNLLSEKELLAYYLHKAQRAGCDPLIRNGDSYPVAVQKRLGDDAPGCLWAKGDPNILKMPAVGLVGSRDLFPENRKFATEAGIQAARQGYALVSGNARGADKTAQNACLEAGGYVICVVADELERHSRKDRVLYLSEDGFNCAFSTQRALSRNRIIHSLGSLTLVAQCSLESGGTWSGTVRNLRGGWSSVFCYHDDSPAFCQLTQMGADPVTVAQLSDLSQLVQTRLSFFD